MVIRPAKGSRHVVGLQSPADLLSSSDEGFIALVMAAVAHDQNSTTRRDRRGPRRRARDLPALRRA
jgi:hypothetical protein